MENTKVKNYTTKELLDKVKTLYSYKEIPKGYWVLGIRSEEDTYNVYDDKFYLFKGEKFIAVTTGTTNSGGYGLVNFAKWNAEGTGIVKSNEWYYDVYEKSDGVTIKHHNGKMQCLRQVEPMLYYRDKDKDKFVEEEGNIYFGILGANFHTNSYTQKTGIISWLINGWSTACQVINDLTKYYQFMYLIPYKVRVSYCLIKEF